MKGHKSPKKTLLTRASTLAFRRQIAVGVVGLVGFVIVWELAALVTSGSRMVWGPNKYSSAFNPYGYSYVNGNGNEKTEIHANEVDILELDQILAGFKHKYPTYQNSDSSDALSANGGEDFEMIDASQASDDTDNDDESSSAAGFTRTSSDMSETTTSNSYNQKPTYESWLMDLDAYNAAPPVVVPPPKPQKNGLWWAVKTYEKYYQKHPIRAYVPRIRPDVQITMEGFYDLFIKHGRPVIMNFDNMRELGFTTKSYSLDKLQELFPYTAHDEDVAQVVEEFVANGIRRADKELDLGPAIASIVRDETLAKKGKLRNFPRNLKVTPAAIQRLDIQKPPLYRDTSKFQLPTVWMGTSSSDTRFHHDCCDNFVYMISGTKRFTLAPASDWRTLKPTCVGANKALCWASVAHPNPGPDAEPMTPRVKKTMDKVHKIVVDVGPGEILFMPAGWFHHIQNLGPTVMVNWWTTGTNQVGLATAVKKNGGMGGVRRQAAASNSNSGY